LPSIIAIPRYARFAQCGSEMVPLRLMTVKKSSGKIEITVITDSGLLASTRRSRSHQIPRPPISAQSGENRSKCPTVKANVFLPKSAPEVPFSSCQRNETQSCCAFQIITGIKMASEIIPAI